MKRLPLLVLLAVLLLFSVAFARELEETQHGKETKVDDVYGLNQWRGGGYGGYGGYGGGYGGGRPGWGGGGWGGRPGWGGGGWGGRPGWGGGGWGGGGWGGGCRWRCGYRCCSAEEYAEFMQAQRTP